MSPVSNRMRIPKSARGIIAALVLTVVLTVFIVSFVILAIKNLWRGEAIISSILWLAIISLLTGTGLYSEGPRKIIIHFLGIFCPYQFIEIVSGKDEAPLIRYGFRLLGLSLFYAKISAASIVSLDWSKGQMNDWHIAVWYKHGRPVDAGKELHPLSKPDQDLFLVGESAEKETTEALGCEILKFLDDSGICLAPGEDENTYVYPIANN